MIEGGGSSVKGPEQKLNEIYITVLENSVGHDYDDEEREDSYEMLRKVLGSIVILFAPLSTQSLTRLLDIPKIKVDQTLEDLHAILDIPKLQNRLIRLHHPSFPDFLLDKDRCGNHFWVNGKQAHEALAMSCIQLMSTSPKQDICGLDAPGVPVTDVANSRVEQCLPSELQYICLHWIQHLQKSSI